MLRERRYVGSCDRFISSLEPVSKDAVEFLSDVCGDRGIYDISDLIMSKLVGSIGRVPTYEMCCRE